MRRLSLLAPLLVAACLDIPPRAGAGIDAPPGGADAPDAGSTITIPGVELRGATVVPGMPAGVPNNQAVELVGPGVNVRFGVQQNTDLPRYPDGLFVGGPGNLLFVNDTSDPPNANAQGCQLENGMGQGVFPFTSAAYVPGDPTLLTGAVLTAVLPGPVAAEVLIDWSAGTAGCMAGSSGRTWMRLFPDGRLVRFDSITAQLNSCTERCGVPINTTYLTSYLALDRATFTSYATSNVMRAATPANGTTVDVGAGEYGCVDDGQRAIGLVVQDSDGEAGRLSWFDDATSPRSVALTHDFLRNGNSTLSLATYDAQSTLWLRPGETCTELGPRMEEERPDFPGMQYQPGNGWYQADLRLASSLTIETNSVPLIGGVAIELAINNLTDPVVVLRDGMTLVAGTHYLEQPRENGPDRYRLLWFPDGLPAQTTLVLTAGS